MHCTGHSNQQVRAKISKSIFIFFILNQCNYKMPSSAEINSSLCACRSIPAVSEILVPTVISAKQVRFVNQVYAGVP